MNPIVKAVGPIYLSLRNSMSGDLLRAPSFTEESPRNEWPVLYGTSFEM